MLTALHEEPNALVLVLSNEEINAGGSEGYHKVYEVQDFLNVMRNDFLTIS